MRTDVTEQDDSQALDQQEPTAKSGVSTRVIILLVVVAVFAGLIAAKYLPSLLAGGSGSSAEASLTSVRNDAAADYEAAVKTGKPIYVLFHSLS